jgi:8-oxo-dGTP pyrophosphatase MutT (NUDIX family)
VENRRNVLNRLNIKGQSVMAITTFSSVTRGRACAIIRHDDRVLLNRYGGDSFWALPGGAVEAGEFSSDGLVREMQEELGVTVEVGRLVWIVENLFAYRATEFTEYGFYYEAAWPLSASALSEDEFAGRESDQFFRWVRNQEVAALDFRPSVLKLPLLALLSGAQSPTPVHFMHKDA